MAPTPEDCPVCWHPIGAPRDATYWGCTFCGNTLEHRDGRWLQVPGDGDEEETFLYLGGPQREQDAAADEFRRMIDAGWRVLGYQRTVAVLRRKRSSGPRQRPDADERELPPSAP